MKLFRIVVLLLFSFAFGDEQTLSDSYGASAIEGALFDDYNQNGLQETGELGLPGWIVYADLNYNNFFDSNEPNAITDSLGYYELAGLEGGSYLISCVTEVCWRQTLMQETQFPLSPSYTSKKAEPTYRTASISSPIYTQGFVSDIIQPNMSQVTDVIRKDDFDLDSQYSQYTGNGYSAVIIDTGIDVDHSFFGPDADNDGVADRIAYQYDFAEDDSDATDYDGHGSNVASIVASSDQTYRGIAPDANIIALKVFTDTGYGDFAYVEEALQWVIQNATVYNIASVNISLGDSSNNSSYVSYYGVSEELEALKELNIIHIIYQ